MIFLKKHGAHFDEKYLWDQLRPIMPYPTGRFFRGTLSQALRARLRSVLSLRDALADISQQHLAKGCCEIQDLWVVQVAIASEPGILSIRGESTACSPRPIPACRRSLSRTGFSRVSNDSECIAFLSSRALHASLSNVA